ncbi:M-phase inducer phosphatase 2-like [Anneissia japonica]|uniref:M-phase inducer phosphatase 2-like n=1 Tax=Anneissia japonica TaxID=1529436 RepID=UPI00142565A4|nr:M-phase inducer phosphatase 2-like [Anneissia japonica]
MEETPVPVKKRLSLSLAAKDVCSPCFSKNAVESPMSSLAHSLIGLSCAGGTPRRRLSLCESPASSRSSLSSDAGNYHARRLLRTISEPPTYSPPPVTPVFSMPKFFSENDDGDEIKDEISVVNQNTTNKDMSTFTKPCIPAGKVQPFRSISAPANLFKDDDGDVKLKTCALTNSEEEEDDGFLEFMDSENTEPNKTSAPSGLDNLITKPLIKKCSPTSKTKVTPPGPLQPISINKMDDFTKLLSFILFFKPNKTSAPSGLDNLITKPLIKKCSPTSKTKVTPPGPLQPISINKMDGNTPVAIPAARGVRRSIFKVPSQPSIQSCSFLKRSERPRDHPSPIQRKKPRSSSIDSGCFKTQTTDPIIPRKLERSQSMLSPYTRPADQPDLLGDQSKPYCLPLLPGKHRDLKCISPNTLGRLINNEFADEIGEYHIVDCRYPYEYEGGHIKVRLIHNVILIKIFCRQKMETYLHLQGLCEPQSYREMLDKHHSEDLKHFRAKSKSWAGERSRLKHSRSQEN